MTTYEKPDFVEIKMDAEIGAYQADFVETEANEDDADE